MVILGIDPGFAILGYGAIRHQIGEFQPMGHGVVLTDSTMKFQNRLEFIYDSMVDMLNKCKPDVMAVERLYFQNNQKTAIDVAQARGVVLLAAIKYGIPVFEYTPLQIKMALTGYGKALKPQIMEMTKRLLKLETMPKYDDTSDALAVAICHAQASSLQQRINKAQETQQIKLPKQKGGRNDL